jgi:hypothetical protein
VDLVFLLKSRICPATHSISSSKESGFYQNEIWFSCIFHPHRNVEAWWCKVRMTPKTPLHAAKSPLEPLDEAPGTFCLSKLLGVTMNELWEALFRENLAKKRGQLCLIDREQMQEFIISNGLAHCHFLSGSRKQPVLRVGFAANDDSEIKQWKSGEEPPRPLRSVGKQFHHDLLDFLKEKKAVSNTTTTSAAQPPAHKESSPPAAKEESPSLSAPTSNEFSSPPATSSPPPPHLSHLQMCSTAPPFSSRT